MSLIQSVHSLGLFDNLTQKSSSFEMIHRPGSDMVVLPSGPGKIQFTTFIPIVILFSKTLLDIIRLFQML